MGLFESIFGTTAQAQSGDYLDSRTQSLANQAFDSAYYQHQSQLARQYGQQQLQNQQAQSQYAQQQAQAGLLGNYHMYKQEPKWVYNGQSCTLKEFTELMWPDDEPARLMFILKHGGV